ncbi:MAG: Arginyl aminopeptidase [Planctomycetota bacterium]
MQMLRGVPAWRLASILAVVAVASGDAFAEELSREQIVARVQGDIEYLASDELEGRGVETKGIELAAVHILKEYEKAGLKPGLPDGTWRQPFEVSLGDLVIESTTGVRLSGPGDVVLELKSGADFQPIRRGANGEASGDLVFIGYGISSEEDKYDDYAGLDVRGKVVVLIRREPQNRPDGAFRGQETSSHAYIDRKLELVKKSGAAAIVFVNDHGSAPTADQDELLEPSAFGNNGDGVPFVHVRQSVLDTVLKSAPLQVDGKMLSSLHEVSQYIDETLKPVSQSLAGWKASVSTRFKSNSVPAYNLIGVVEGEGPLANETIVIGGHYDHLGLGGYGSRSQSRTGEVHNGADDNASGTAAVLELARRVASGPKPKRRMVFICFSGEERGLLGSEHYVRNPVFPLENTVAMLNFDMIGNLKDNRVEVNGVGSSAAFEEIVKKADEAVSIDITINPSSFAGSDHLPFYQRQIPVMFCFTGMTDIYHTPDDDSKTLNMEGAVLVIDYSEQLLRGMDALESRPVFAEGQPARRRPTRRTPFLGLQPDLGASGENGIVVRSVRPSSPAEMSGIAAGDVITMVGEQKVEGYQTLVEQLVAAKPGDVMKLTVKRGEELKEVEVKLGEPQR